MYHCNCWAVENWLDLEIRELWKISQTQKEKHCIISLYLNLDKEEEKGEEEQGGETEWEGRRRNH